MQTQSPIVLRSYRGNNNYVLTAIGIIIGCWVSWLGYKWLKFSLNLTLNKQTKLDQWGPWILLIIGILSVLFIVKKFIQGLSNTAKKQNTQLIPKIDGTIEILPKGILINKADIRALRFTKVTLSNGRRRSHHGRMNSLKLYRLYLELVDGSLIFLSKEVTSRTVEITNLSTYKNVESVKSILKQDIPLFIPDNHLDKSNLPNKLCFKLSSSPANIETTPDLIRLPQRVPSIISLLPLLVFFSLFFALWIQFAKHSLFLLIPGVPIIIFIFVSLLTSKTIYVNFQSEKIEMALVRQIFGFNYLTINYQCPRKAIDNVRFTWDDAGYMILLDLNNEAPPVKLIWQVIGYGPKPEKKSFETNGNVFLLSASQQNNTLEEMYSLYSRFKSILM